jgi:filamentous hemagglutinin
VVNNGTVDAALTSGTATINVPLTTSLAKLKMAAGTETVSLTQGGTLSGTLTEPSGTIFSLDAGSFAVNDATFSGAGLTRMTNGTATLTGTTTVNTLFSFSGGTITGAGNLTLTGQTTWSKGTIDLTGTTTSSGALTVPSAGSSFLDGPFTNSGTVTIPANDNLELESLTVLTNAAAGTIDLAGSGAELTQYYSGATVVNNGTVDAALTSGTATINVPLTNNAAGVVNLGTATLAATQGFTNSGKVNIGYQTFNVAGGMTLKGNGTIAFDVSATAHGTLTSATRTKLGGHVAIALASGYTPAVGTAVTLVTTTGTQSGSFIVDSTQIIGSTNTGWKMATKGNKVTVTVRPLSDVAGSLTAPATATQTIPFTVNASVSNNGPEAASSAAVTLTLPTDVAVSGSLPAGCTQPTTTTVKCTAGSLATSAKKTFAVALVASASGSDTITASATTANTDLVPGNNKQSVVVTAV